MQKMKVQLKGTELRKLTTRVDDSQTKLKGIYLPDIMKPTFSQTYCSVTESRAGPVQQGGSPSFLLPQKVSQLCIMRKYALPEGLFLREKFLPFSVEITLHFKFNFAKLATIEIVVQYESKLSLTFSSSRRNCSSLRRTLWDASSSGSIDESLLIKKSEMSKAEQDNGIRTASLSAPSWTISRYGKFRIRHHVSGTSSQKDES